MGIPQSKEILIKKKKRRRKKEMTMMKKQQLPSLGIPVSSPLSKHLTLSPMFFIKVFCRSIKAAASFMLPLIYIDKDYEAIRWFITSAFTYPQLRLQVSLGLR